MNVAFVQHAENDVHRDQRREDQPRLIGERCLKRLGGSLEIAVDICGHPHLAFDFFHCVHGFAERYAFREVE